MMSSMKFWFRLAVLSSLAVGAWAQSSSPKAASTPKSSALDAALFYQILLGELNTRQGSPGSGFSIMLDAARKTRDPALFQRSVDMALQARSGEAALQAAQSWKKEIPTATEASRYVLQILLALNRIEEAGKAVAVLLNPLEARLQHHGQLGGQHPCAADIAIFPFVRQFAHTYPAWFAAQPWPRLIAWLAAFEGSEAYAQVMAKHPAWQDPVA